MVGAVVVDADGTLVGEGYHRRFGGPHAEVEALLAAGPRAAGGTLFVTLEPCTETILAARVRRVVVALRDPNPVAAGGVEQLRQAGLEVEVGAGTADARWLNRRWLTWVERRTPWVTAKIAASLDGRTATASGESRWITGDEARARGWGLREEHDAIAVGVGTVLADDPSLERHLGLNPTGRWLRVVFDSCLRLPLSAAVVRDDPGQTLVCHGPAAPLAAREALAQAGVGLLEIALDESARVDVAIALARLGEMEISSLLVEGGGLLHGSFFDRELVDEVALFLAPMVIGGHGRPAVAGRGVERLGLAPRFSFTGAEQCGTDLLVTALRADASDVHRPC